MEIYILAMQVFIVPQVIAGFVGGLLGIASIFRSNKELYGLELTIIFSLFGILVAGSVAEYAFMVKELDSVILHIVLGSLTGLLGSSGIDALRLTAPKFMQDLVDDTGQSLIKRILVFLKLRKDE